MEPSCMANREVARAERIRRHGASLRHAAGIAAFFVVEEVEEAIALDRAADGPAKLVAHQRLARHTGLVVEPSVGRVAVCG